MTAKNKARGNSLENQVVRDFSKVPNVRARRFWGSNGESGGEHATVDILVKSTTWDLRLQCKKKRKLPDWLGFSDHVDGVVFSEDRGKRYLLIELDEFLKRVKE